MFDHQRTLLMSLSLGNNNNNRFPNCNLAIRPLKVISLRLGLLDAYYRPRRPDSAISSRITARRHRRVKIEFPFYQSN